MKKRAVYSAIIAVNILAIVIFMVAYSDATLPLIGHDYRLFIPRLLDTYLHYKVNGLTIQWYTPSFGGGLPAYPNPLQMQYSLTQLLTWFVNPWTAVLASAAIYTSIGFLVTYLLLKNILGFRPLSAILGASFFAANGFMIERVVIGHVNFITFPLIVILVYAIVNPKLPRWLAGSLIAAMAAALVYTGGVYIGVIGIFTALLTLPLLYFMKPDLFSWRKILPVLIWGGALAALLCGSKLYATAAYMKNFPRLVYDDYSVNWIHGLMGLAMQLIGPTSTLPIIKLAGKTYISYTLRLEQWTGTQYQFWELDSSLTPGLFFLLGVGLLLPIFRKHKLDRQNLVHKIIAAACLIFALILTTEFALAKGFLYDQLRQLPVLESLHANVRYASSFALPLAILAAKAFDSWTKNWKSKVLIFSTFALINAASLASLWSYYYLPLDIQARFVELPSMIETWDQIHAGNTFPVKNIVSDMNDYEVIMYQSSNVSHHYDPLFGDQNVLLQPLVHDGSVFDIEDGYYNMTDPTSLVFPQSADSYLFERIPVSDYQKLVDFVNRRQPDWKLPLLQALLDWAAGLTFIAVILAWIGYSVQRWLPIRLPVPVPSVGQ